MLSALLPSSLHLELHDEHVVAFIYIKKTKPVLLIHLQDESTKVQQEAEEQLADLQQQLQEQLLAAGSLTERVLSAEASSTTVSIPVFILHPF